MNKRNPLVQVRATLAEAGCTLAAVRESLEDTGSDQAVNCEALVEWGYEPAPESTEDERDEVRRERRRAEMTRACDNLLEEAAQVLRDHPVPPPVPPPDPAYEAELARARLRAAEAAAGREEARLSQETFEERTALREAAERRAFFERRISGKTCPDCKEALPDRLTASLFDQVGWCSACKVVYHEACARNHKVDGVCSNCGESTWRFYEPIIVLHYSS